MCCDLDTYQAVRLFSPGERKQSYNWGAPRAMRFGEGAEQGHLWRGSKRHLAWCDQPTLPSWSPRELKLSGPSHGLPHQPLLRCLCADHKTSRKQLALTVELSVGSGKGQAEASVSTRKGVGKGEGERGGTATLEKTDQLLIWSAGQFPLIRASRLWTNLWGEEEEPSLCKYKYVDRAVAMWWIALPGLKESALRVSCI